MTQRFLLNVGFRILVLFALNALSRNFASSEVDQGRPNRVQHPHSLDSGGSLDEQQTLGMHEMIGAMLGFGGGEGTPITGPTRNFDDKRSGGGQGPLKRRAPRYMQRLYEKYLTGEPVRSDSQVADTIRNIIADLEKEAVLKAEVHLYKRRPKADPQLKEIGSIAVKVYELGFGYLRQRASFHLPESGHARWHVFDVTPVIRSVNPSGSRHGGAAAARMLAVSFEEEEEEEADDGSAAGGSNLRLSRFLRRISRPSLVVFSREDHEKKQPGDRLEAVFGDSEEDDDDVDDDDSREKESRDWNYDNPLRSGRRHRIVGAGKRRSKVSARRSRNPQQRNPGAGVTPTWNWNQSVDDGIFEMEESFSNPEGHGHLKADAMTSKGHELEEEIGEEGRVKFFHANFSPLPGVERNRIRGFRERSRRKKKRKKRFINDNEVIQREDETTTERREEMEDEDEEEEEEEEEPVRRFYYSNLPDTNPGILKGRRNNSGRKGTSVATASPILAFGEIAEEDDDDEDSARQRRRKRKKEEERRAREQESSLSVFISRVGYQRRRPSRRNNPPSSSSSSSSSSSGVCRKRELVVNFADIGWKDWIISPSAFEANYCDGSCAYPMASRLRPTNHATIQSIVNAIGLLERVPSPCCVPSSLSSVTLLYLDPNQNVVLKNFPDMTVRSCACR